MRSILGHSGKQHLAIAEPERRPLLVSQSAYLTAAGSSPLQLIVVGKDPFPTDATGIPFCKTTWEQQLAFNCSGQYVLRSLGVNLMEAQRAYLTPSALFEYLASIGILFLNASYTFIGQKIRKSKHWEHLYAAHLVNDPFIRVANKVIYCGEAQKIKWVTDIDTGWCVVHPDVRNRVNPRTSMRWSTVWNDNALRDTFGLRIDCGG